jgi:hypothetical protein
MTILLRAVATAAFLSAGLAAQSVEISPLVGFKFFGGFPLRAQGSNANTEAELKNSLQYGVSLGFRAGDDGFAGIRWKRQSTELNLFPPGGAPALRPAEARLDQFHGEFTYDFLDETSRMRPFLLAGAGITRMSFNGDWRVRFSFGLGGGVKVYFNRWLGLRLEGQLTHIYFPNSGQDNWCFRGCYALPTRRLVNQAELSAGPIFRF